MRLGDGVVEGVAGTATSYCCCFTVSELSDVDSVSAPHPPTPYLPTLRTSHPHAGLLDALQGESPRSEGASTPSPTSKAEEEYPPPAEAMLLADGEQCHATEGASCAVGGGPVALSVFPERMQGVRRASRRWRRDPQLMEPRSPSTPSRLCHLQILRYRRTAESGDG